MQPRKPLVSRRVCVSFKTCKMSEGLEPRKGEKFFVFFSLKRGSGSVVEHRLAKARVASSNLVFRSIYIYFEHIDICSFFLFNKNRHNTIELEMNMTLLKKYLPLVTYVIVLYLALSNLNVVMGIIGKGFSVFMPLIIGIAIAFVLNLLMKLIENNLFEKVKKLKNIKWIQKNRRVLSIIMTYLTALIIIAVLIVFVVPQVVTSASVLIDKLPGYGKQITDFGTSVYLDLGLSDELLNDLFANFKDLFVGVSEFTATTIMALVNMTLDITAGALNVFIGLIFSVYLLAQKEHLISILKRVNRAFVNPYYANGIENIASESNVIFSKFVGGQLTEAMILGSLCFVGLILFNIPYAPLVSVLIAVTSLIPVVGAFIGTVPAVLIIAMENPTQALFFIIFIVILQQLEGNLIYPKVVGSAIGIGGFWVFLAITVGGGLFGILGMLLGVPLMAVIYTLMRSVVNKRLTSK